MTERCFIIPLQISHGLALVLPDAKGRGRHNTPLLSRRRGTNILSPEKKYNMLYDIFKNRNLFKNIFTSLTGVF